MIDLKRAWPAITFVVVNLLLFFQFPLGGSLPGNSDTVLSIALTNVFNEAIGLLLTGRSVDTVMYPVSNFLGYGENCFALGFIFTFFKLLTSDDLLAYWLFMVTIFSLNGYGVYRLVSAFVTDRVAAVMAGLAFSLSTFMIANIDDPNVIFVFVPLMALVFLEKGMREGRVVDLKKAALLSGLQIWFGMYVFIFQAIVLAIFCVVFQKRLRELLGVRDWGGIFLRFFGVSIPLFALYLSYHFDPNLVSVYENPLSRKLSSLHWYNFFNVLPDNLIYSSENNVSRPDVDLSLWYSIRKTCFTGFLIPIFAMVGLGRFFRARTRFLTFMLVVATVFFAFSLGDQLFDFEGIVALPLGTYFRVASRCFMLTLLVITVFFGIGMAAVLERLRASSRRLAITVAAAIMGFVLLENVPFPMWRFEYKDSIRPVESYTKFFAPFKVRQVIADLPSTYKAKLPQDGPLWTYSRDALYMNWQPHHGQIIVGGINAYLPRTRVEVDVLFERLPEPDAIEGLSRFGVDYLVFHKKFILYPWEDILGKMKIAPGLGLQFEDADIAIFKILRTTP